MDNDLFANETAVDICTNSRNPLLTQLLCFVLAMLALVMLCGNLLVIISIVYFRQLHTPTNYLVLSLAVSDLLLGVVVLPFSIVLFVTPCWFFHDMLCRVRGCFDAMLCMSSILNLCFISIERYYAVCRPLSYRNKMNPCVIAAMISVTWAVSALCGFMLTFSGQNHRNECAFVQYFQLGAVAAVVGFYIPAVIMMTIYTKILLVVRRQARSIHHANSTVAVSKVERRATWTLAVVIGVFFICWAPISVCATYMPFHHFSVPLYVMETSKWLAWLNSMLNPFIYAFSYSWFRSAFRMILSGKIFDGACANTRLF